MRWSIEVLVDFGSLCCGVLPQKTPKQNSYAVRFASRMCCRRFTFLPSMLGVPPRTPLPIDLTAWQRTSPRCCWSRNSSQLERTGESKTTSLEVAFLAASVTASSNEPATVQGVKEPPAPRSLALALPSRNAPSAHLMHRACLSSTSCILPDLQCAQRHHRAEHAQNVEPHHDLRFVPTLLLEMMVNRRH